MAAYPGAEATFQGFTSSHTLSQDNHASQHNLEQAEIVATQHKIGTGASTPTSGMLLRGNGTGTSIWAQANLTTDVTGVLPQANGGTGTTLATGTGKVVYQTSPTITGPTFTGGGSWDGSPTLTTPVIADHTNATHNHQNAAGGGTLNAGSALQAGSLTAGILGTDSSWVWQSWVPVWTNLTISTSSVVANYIQIGKTVHIRLKVISANTFAISGDVEFTLPVSPNITSAYVSTDPIGHGLVLDASAGIFYFSQLWVGTTTTRGRIIVWDDNNSAYLRAAALSSTIPMTWATPDEIHLSATYEAA